MIDWVRINKLRKLARSFLIEATAVHNHNADTGSVIADKLGRRMYSNVHTMRKNIDQIRCCKGIVGNKRNFMSMNQLC